LRDRDPGNRAHHWGNLGYKKTIPLFVSSKPIFHLALGAEPNRNLVLRTV
jgi:hypothetical protein